MTYNIEVCIDCNIMPVMKDNPFFCNKCYKYSKAEFDSLNITRNIIKSTNVGIVCNNVNFKKLV